MLPIDIKIHDALENYSLINHDDLIEDYLDDFSKNLEDDCDYIISFLNYSGMDDSQNEKKETSKNEVINKEEILDNDLVTNIAPTEPYCKFKSLDSVISEQLITAKNNSLLEDNKPKTTKFKSLSKKKKKVYDPNSDVYGIRPPSYRPQITVDGKEYTLPSDEELGLTVYTAAKNYDNYLLDLYLDKDVPKPPEIMHDPVVEPLFQDVKITSSARDKAINISRLNNEGKNKSYELYMHMLKEKDYPYDIATDVMVSFNQTVTSTRCTPSSSSFNIAKDFMKANDKEYFGWMHSHGDMAVFNSNVDINNLSVNSITNSKRKILKLGFTESIINYVPSIVINNHGDLFGSYGISYNYVGEPSQFEVKEVPTTICESDLIAEFDRDAMKEFLDREVTYY